MTTGANPLQNRPVRAPQENRAVFVEPAWEEVGGLVAENRRAREEYEYDFQGRSLSDLARQARHELVRGARRYTASYRDVPDSSPEGTSAIFLAGHQPQLYHPGVWFKNFALHTLARQHSGLAVNLVIDNDAVKGTTLRVPGGTTDEPHVTPVPLDRAGDRVPYEERRIVDRQMFAEFGDRAAREIASLVPDPLLHDYWPLAVGRTRETDNLGECIAQSRHQLEGAWGLETLEIPQSRVCQMEPFHWLVAHLLARLPRFWQVHNDAVHEYRRVNRIRSASHPFPDLGAADDWLEVPCWVWTAEDPKRRHLFARPKGKEIILTDREHCELALPLSEEGEAHRAVARLQQLEAKGCKIRCRAVITTLWARLVLGDLFVHGIGGAKYDQVTDAIISRFFGLAPPAFLTISATLHLPVERLPVPVDVPRNIDQRLRELTYHPERFINGAAFEGDGEDSPEGLIAEKKQWINTTQTRQNARRRCRSIRRINEALQPWVEDQRERLHAIREEAVRATRALQILKSREYAFCLYPESVLREFLREKAARPGAARRAPLGPNVSVR